MCGGCGGTPSQSSTTSTPPSWALQGINSVAGGAGGIAGLYQSGAYGGYPLQGTAPMNQSQLDALNMMMSAPGVAGPFTTQAMQDYYGGANLIGGGSQLIGGGAGMISEGGPFLGAGANIIGEALPYFGQAANYAAQGTTPLAGEINQFMNPYTQKAVNATEAQFNNQNAIQSNQLLGSAIQAGNAFGGDREGVAQAQLAGQQQMAEAPVIAGMYNTEFNQAVQDAALQNQQNLQAAGISTGIGTAQVGAGAQMGNIGLGLGTLGTQMGGLGGIEGGLGAQMAGIGTQTGQLGLSNAQLELGAGAAAFPAATVGQQTSQAALNAQYAQLMQQFGLPAGIESWLAGIQLPAYGETGYQASTTGQQGNLWSDFLGLATAGIGAFGKTAAAKATGKDGGRIGFQGGGVPLGGVVGAPVGSPQYSAFLSPGIFVPPNIRSHGSIPAYHAPTQQPQQHTPQDAGAGLLGLATLAKKFSLPQANVGVSGSPDDVSVNSGVGTADIADHAAADAGDWRGGVVGYQDGGDTGDYADYMAAVAGPLSQEAAANARLETMLPARSGGVIGYADAGEVPDDADTNPVASSGISPDLPPPQDIAPAPRVAAADNIGNYSDAIAAVESKGSGDYGAVGPPVRRRDHIDHAYGRHQVMGDNIPEWTKEATGRAMTPQEFLRSPEAQEAVFRHKFGSLVDKYGNPQDAASVWFTGRPQSQGGESSDGYITGNEYVRRFNNALGSANDKGVNALSFANDRGVAPDEGQGAITHALGFDREAGVSPPVRTAQAASISGDRTDTGGLLGFIDSLRPTMSPETKMALMSAGFGMMGPNRDFFRNLGAGAQQGIGTYMTAEKLSQEAQATQARIKREQEQSYEEHERTGIMRGQLQRATELAHSQEQQRLFQQSLPHEISTPFGKRSILSDGRGGWIYADTRKPLILTPQQAKEVENRPLPQDPSRPYAGVHADTDTMMEAQEKGLHGQAFLDAVPQPWRNSLEKVGNYEAPITDFSKMGRNGPDQDMALSMAAQFNPNYDQNWYALQGRAYQNFFNSTAPQSPNVLSRAYNTAMGHAGDLAEAIHQIYASNPGIFDEARKSGTPFLSYLAAHAEQKAVRGTPEGEAWNTVKTILPLYSAETARFYSGSAGSETERQQIQAPFDMNLSEREILGALHAQKEMFKSKTRPMEQEYQNIIDAPGLKEYGTKKAFKDWHLDRANALKADATIDRLYQAVGAGAPQKGDRKQFSTKSGPRWGVFNGKDWVPE